MTEIFTASTLEEAKQKAAEAFGVSVSEITFQVLEEPKRSLLGGLFGKKEEYRVEASYTAPAVAEPAAEIAEEAVETVTETVAVDIAAEEPETEPEDDDVSGKPAVPEEIQRIWSRFSHSLRRRSSAPASSRTASRSRSRATALAA